MTAKTGCGVATEYAIWIKETIAITMKFCKRKEKESSRDCGGMLSPSRNKGKDVLVCRKCGASTKFNEEERNDFTTTGASRAAPKSIVPIIDSEKQLSKLSTINVECAKCKNIGVIWWMVQTRGVDEPPTRFYKCVKCGHTWREYA